MYIQKPNNYRKLTKKQVSKKITTLFTDKELAKIQGHALDYFIKGFYDLYTSILKKWRVYAFLEKSPRGNLDTGRHYYTIRYLTIIDGQPVEDKIWPTDEIIAKKFYFDINNRDTNMYKYVFGSGAIGMSRMLNATDGFANMFKKITGVYFQLS